MFAFLKLFEQLRKEQPQFADKVKVVCGELTEERLGMSDEDFEMLKNEFVSIMMRLLVVTWSEQDHDRYPLCRDHQVHREDSVCCCLLAFIVLL